MSNKKPKPGACGAKVRRGGFCAKPPAVGKTRCRLHGGAPGSGRPIIHGGYSKRFKHASKVMVELIGECLEDPDLLDMSRPVAVLQALQFEAGMIPDDDVIRELARSKQQVKDEEPASEAQFVQTKWSMIKNATSMATKVQNAQQAVVREASQKEMLGQAVAPLFGRLLERFSAVVRQHVKDADEREALLEAARREFRNVIVAAYAIAE